MAWRKAAGPRWILLMSDSLGSDAAGRPQPERDRRGRPTAAQKAGLPILATMATRAVRGSLYLRIASSVHPRASAVCHNEGAAVGAILSGAPRWVVWSSALSVRRERLVAGV